MKTNHIVQAWKNLDYRQKLSAAEQAELPAHPSGMVELADADLGAVSGGGSITNAGHCLSIQVRCTV
jgi:mersacidin/lichenicidin family type 2 lantibiotic